MKQILDPYEITGGGTAYVYLDGKPFLNFGGNNYLALNSRKELKQAALRELEKTNGYSMHLPDAYGAKEEAFMSVEEKAALFFDTEAAVYLPSGYFIAHAAMSGLEGLYDAIVIDELAHWCTQDAANLSGHPVLYFKHNDLKDLEKVLTDLPASYRPLIATDGCFATTGEIPPINVYEKLAKEKMGVVYVDESHSIGVVGENGRGAKEFCRAGDSVHVGATLSKGICGQGAVFIGTHEMVKKAKTSTVLRGSSKGSPISAAVSATALEIVRKNPKLVKSLYDKTKYLKSKLSVELVSENSPAPIVSFSLGSFKKNRALQEFLFKRNIYVLHSNYIASGPSGIIRLSIFADHQTKDLNIFIEALNDFLNKDSFTK
ncbi:2-amino-3-ketobutyrate coenzyme A ligase [Croceitalea dokdonensis DOKDO 023]|uniref:2-amino-3-ketobutyrate coenzyme A ligase n=1 Tax=Croceitalea dokdonensis DOKDO 023 TaxID=1300341 RepID=A0A0N8H409_9FLAO|nr:pyridoxal phosphate-dependent aminotransferase family protein [Croceitalea dokdonensis]KPM32060.1 2-amino-3-ketobutyrate coenzyme A ligase [Croceitalea dokdonensis DOKDO 023]